MGLGMKCTLGFSIAFGTAFSEQLERHGGELQRSHRQGRHDLDAGLEALHDAIDAALAGDDAGATAAAGRGLALLASCNDHLTAAAAALVRTRTDLLERESVDPADSLLERERRFAAVDYEAAHRELAARHAEPQQAWWGALVDRLRTGGGRGGLRLLDRYHRELQSDLRAVVADMEAARRFSGRSFAEALHGNTLAVATVEIGFARIAVTCTYLGLLCEHASLLQERATAPALAAAV
jgi:hypothetical protein